jgi:plastocyanin
MFGRDFWRPFASGLLAGCAALLSAQEAAAPGQLAEVTAKLAPPQVDAAHKAERTPPAVIWLNPLRPGAVAAATPGSFTLLQKNKMFTPHLLVVSVGSSVQFPNADPFFHNVFSLFDGRRFDLGLYEAGSTRSVVFSREGVSYIFCNIHSEMSAVVIAFGDSPLWFRRSAGHFPREGRSRWRLRLARVDRRAEAKFAGPARPSSPCHWRVCRSRGDTHGPPRTERAPEQVRPPVRA